MSAHVRSSISSALEIAVSVKSCIRSNCPKDSLSSHWDLDLHFTYQAQGYKAFFVLNSAEHEISSAFKTKNVEK